MVSCRASAISDCGINASKLQDAIDSIFIFINFDIFNKNRSHFTSFLFHAYNNLDH